MFFPKYKQQLRIQLEKCVHEKYTSWKVVRILFSLVLTFLNLKKPDSPKMFLKKVNFWPTLKMAIIKNIYIQMQFK